MHLITTTSSKLDMLAPKPFGPGFTAEEAESADCLEVHGTGFSEGVLDFVEFRLLKQGEVTQKRKVNGY